jgi:hypothetical protein
MWLLLLVLLLVLLVSPPLALLVLLLVLLVCPPLALLLVLPDLLPLAPPLAVPRASAKAENWRSPWAGTPRTPGPGAALGRRSPAMVDRALLDSHS